MAAPGCEWGLIVLTSIRLFKTLCINRRETFGSCQQWDKGWCASKNPDPGIFDVICWPLSAMPRNVSSWLVLNWFKIHQSFLGRLNSGGRIVGSLLSHNWPQKLNSNHRAIEKGCPLAPRLTIKACAMLADVRWMKEVIIHYEWTQIKPWKRLCVLIKVKVK